MRLGLIGGTAMVGLAVEDLDTTRVDEVVADTAHGDVPMTCVTLENGSELFFIQRHHGEEPTPPHKIKHRANMKALACAGVDAIIAICSVGTIPEDFPPGSVGYATQYIDFSGRAVTYHHTRAQFTSMTAPFDAEVNAKLAKVLGELQPGLGLERTYWFTEGPQFETAAEINAIATLGGEVVGMTMARECKLATELKIPYAAILVASNWAAGRNPDGSTVALDHEEVSATAAERLGPVVECIKALSND